MQKRFLCQNVRYVRYISGDTNYQEGVQVEESSIRGGGGRERKKQNLVGAISSVLTSKLGPKCPYRLKRFPEPQVLALYLKGPSHAEIKARRPFFLSCMVWIISKLSIKILLVFFPLLFLPLPPLPVFSVLLYDQKAFFNLFYDWDSVKPWYLSRTSHSAYGARAQALAPLGGLAPPGMGGGKKGKEIKNGKEKKRKKRKRKQLQCD